MSEFYTQTVNTLDAVQTGVNPQNGLFSFNVTLANIVGNNNMGPTATLMLSYSPLTSANPNGVGVGCSLGVSYYDKDALRLYLDTGEQYSILENADNSVTVEQKKLANFNFEKISDDEYHVIYKNGNIQVLTGLGGTLFYPATLYSPAGWPLYMKWIVTGAIVQLQAVWDDSSSQTSPLCSVSYVGANVIFNFWPGTSEAYSMTLTLGAGDVLSSITQGVLSWAMTYTPITVLGEAVDLLTSVVSPTGYRQTVTYETNKMPFPDVASMPSGLPAVTRYVKSPGWGQPDITTTYEYDINKKHNYLGFGYTGGGPGWAQNRDFLADIGWYPDDSDGAYLYSTLVTVVDADNGDAPLSQQTRTWNNFHLATQQVSVQGSCTNQTDLSYTLTTGENLDSQPAQYAMPTTQVVTYTDTSLPAGGPTVRSETTTASYDAAGNLLQQLSPDGVLTTYTYYPPEGTSGQCPAEPNGFARFVETKTVSYPEVTGESGAVYPSTSKIYSYRYSGYSTREGSPTSVVVLRTQVTSVSNEATLTDTIITYNTTPGDTEFGRITQTQSTHYNEVTGRGVTSTADVVFTVNGESLDQNVTFTGHDGLTFTVQRNQSRFSGRVSSTTDKYGNQTLYQYNVYGQVTQRTQAAGTDYADTRTFTYALDINSTSPKFTTQSQDSQGNVHTTYRDGMGRVIKLTRNDPMDTSVGTTEYIQLTQSYDNQGRALDKTVMDHYPDSYDVGTTASLLATSSYNGWGQNNRVQYSDLEASYANHDPVNRQTLAQRQTTDTDPVGTVPGYTRTTYNNQQCPVAIDMLDADYNVLSTQKFEYDGKKQLRLQTDENGVITTYDYDAWGRVVAQTLPDESVVRKEYPHFSSKPLITRISITPAGKRPLLLGTRRYDSLHRCTRETRGGRMALFAYPSSNSSMSPVPGTVTTPMQEDIQYQYIPQLHFAITEIKGPDVTLSRQYDPETRLMTRATHSGDGNMTREETYNLMGDNTGETLTPDSGTVRSTRSTYTLNGKRLTFTDVSGNTRMAQYNQDGRLTDIEDSDVVVTLGYDSYGRRVTQTVKEKSGNTTLTTTLSYDSIERETKRVITSSEQGELLTINQDYSPNNRVSQRTTTQGTTTLRQETYTYDSRNRLATYQCTGTELPLDYVGNAITEQRFTYDALSNIIQCDTDFTRNGTPGTDTAVYSFDNVDDPSQLTSLTHTDSSYPASITLAYDANGRMTTDDMGRIIAYNSLGRVTSVTEGAQTVTYGYDGLNTLVTQSLPNDIRHLYYLGHDLMNEVQENADQQTRYAVLGKASLGMTTTQGTTIVNYAHLGSDSTGSVLRSLEPGMPPETLAYTAWGEQFPSSVLPGVPAFNAEHRDPATGNYNLGNGYRPYSPTLRRFICPDSASPFGVGGTNLYAYCGDDPINFSDPSGHMKKGETEGILGVLSFIGTTILSVLTCGCMAPAAAAAETMEVTDLAAGGAEVVEDATTGVVTDTSEVVADTSSGEMGANSGTQGADNTPSSPNASSGGASEARSDLLDRVSSANNVNTGPESQNGGLKNMLGNRHDDATSALRNSDEQLYRKGMRAGESTPEEREDYMSRRGELQADIVKNIERKYGKNFGPIQNARRVLSEHLDMAIDNGYRMTDPAVQDAFGDHLMQIVTSGFKSEDVTGTQLGNATQVNYGLFDSTKRGLWC
ncbi:RHS repeat-associated core domain [Serratia quinivorans]|uniref:RHS repeat-associated core domain-containing protein n=1 Tax=Serratia quinivorans TaxID=137545 RepID=UPI00217828F5|nr:RHS repeat-associated core domain-containing protein [Serratia quinivorans]CAI1964863.1 RHS repeat-associated core domain [Serratia quinivorans]